jgi:hypothetical protein
VIVEAVLDHLVVASPDPEATCRTIAERTGVELSIGGSHVGLGTRNWLGRLAEGVFLEVIGPDPDQPEPEGPRPFGVDAVSESRLFTWCARRPDLAELCTVALAAGLDLGAPYEVSRQTPTRLLTWHLAMPSFDTRSGTIPFFIDWGDSPHPSTTAATGLRLERFTVEHPRPGDLEQVFGHLGVRQRVGAGPIAKLEAVISGPGGEMQLT